MHAEVLHGGVVRTTGDVKAAGEELRDGEGAEVSNTFTTPPPYALITCSRLRQNPTPLRNLAGDVRI
jgi:hypothetical protein